jgi:prolipoprotein diacylglyceryl transferase
MYPNLSYIIEALTGWGPDNGFSVVQTFGLMLAISFIASGWFFYLELKRKGDEGIFHPTTEVLKINEPVSITDILWNSLLGFILGFKLVFILQNGATFQEDPGAVLLSSLGDWTGGIVGLLLLGGWKVWQKMNPKAPMTEKKVQIWPHDRVWDMAMIAGISGVAGSKLFSILEDPQALMADPMGQILSGSGLNFLGGLILGFIAVFTYIRMKKMPGIHVLDAVAPALVVGYAVGRIGCQLSGDGDWGIVNLAPVPGWWFLPEWIWSFDFPHNVLNEGIPIEGCTWKYCHKLAEPVYPTAFYETMLGAVMLGILWILRKRISIPGVLFFIYLLLISTERFFIEKIRVNDRYTVLGADVTQAEAISVGLFLIGIAGILILWLRDKKSRA